MLGCPTAEIEKKMKFLSELKKILKLGGRDIAVIALAFSLIFNPISPAKFAQAATLNAGSNFTVCTVQSIESAAFGAATVQWTFYSSVGNTQAAYHIEIDDDPDFGSVRDSGVVSDAAARAYSTSSLTVGTRYYWRLQITDDNSSVTDWISGDSFLILLPSINLKGGLILKGDIKLK